MSLIDRLVDNLAAYGISHELDRDEVLFQQNDRADDVFCVLHGRLRLERILEDGSQVTLSVIRAPALLAEAALFSDRYHCCARAETDSYLHRIPKASVLGLLSTDPSFSLELIQHLSFEVRKLRSLLELRNIRRATDRLLQYLSLFDTDVTGRSERPLVGIAAEIGMTPETLYRTVARLEKAGLIVRDGRSLRLRNDQEP